MKYRRDSRSEEQFAKDIEECSLLEQRLIKSYINDLSLRKGKTYSYKNNGVDNTGKLIEDDKKVTTAADFIIITPEGNEYAAEIKFSKPERSYWHLKISQLVSYEKQNCCVIMFMGIETNNCRYTIILPQDIPNILQTAYKTNLWYKPVVRLFNKDFTWYPVKI